MQGRRANIDLVCNQKNITEKISEYMVGLTYTDNSCDTSDSISIDLSDYDKKWMNKWFPEKGDVFGLSIKLSDWLKEGDDKLLKCGSFILDSFSFTGNPVVLKVEAAAYPTKSGFKYTKRTKTYENTTIKSIANEIARRYGISCVYEGNEIKVLKAEQSKQEDCNFLNELVKKFGLVMKIYRHKIIIYNEALYEAKKSVQTITPNDIESGWTWNTSTLGTYTGAVYSYTNNDSTYKLYVGDRSNRVLRIEESASSLYEAELITLARINEENKKETTMQLVMSPARPNIIATSCIDLKGFGKMDGKYFVETVTWTISNGCRQRLNLRKVTDRFTRKDVKANA